MNLETIRIMISVAALAMAVLIWGVLRRIDRRLGRIASRLDAEAHALHVLAKTPGTGHATGPMRSLPPN